MKITEIRERHALLNSLQFVPNNGAFYLESVLGINFSRKPLAIPFDDYNAHVLSTSGRIGEKLRDDLWLADGEYVDTLHAYFFREDSKQSFLLALHENFHAYHMELDPKGFRKVDPSSKIKNSPEMIVTFRTFYEGIAEWAAIEALNHSSNPADRNIALAQRDNLLFGIPCEGGTTFDTDEPVKQALTYITNFIEEADINVETQRRAKRIKWALFPPSISDIFLYTNSYQDTFVFHPSLYVAGYNFVYHAMHELVDVYGIQLREAINLIILNPPKTIDDLKKPRGFINRKFSAGEEKIGKAVISTQLL